MILILILFAICITLLTVNALLIHRKLAKLQDELGREQHFRYQLEAFYERLYDDHKAHMYKYH